MRTARLLVLSAASAFAALALGLGCSGDAETPQEPEPPEEVPRVHGLTEEQAAQPLAQVGDRTITVGQFADELASKGAFVRTRYNSPERRREFLDKMVEFELLAQEAERRGFLDRPDVQRARRQEMVRGFLEARRESAEQAVTATDVRQYYDAHRSDFESPAQVRASQIQVSDRRLAERLLGEVRADVGNHALFRRLVREHSEDEASKARDGDLGFFSQLDERLPDERELPEELVEAAFSITAQGAVYAEVVQSGSGFHIVKLTARRNARNQDLEAAERVIRNRLQREREDRAIETLLAELRSAEDVEQNLDRLEQVRVQVEGGDAPTDEPIAPRLRR